MHRVTIFVVELNLKGIKKEGEINCLSKGVDEDKNGKLTENPFGVYAGLFSIDLANY